MKKINDRLLLLTLICAVMMCLSHLRLINQYNDITEENNRKNLEIIVYKNELEEQQKIHAFLNEKNRELIGKNNFLESQNKMLMEREVTE